MSNSTPKTIRLHDETIEEITKLAKQENRNFSNMIEHILITVFKDEKMYEKIKTIKL